MSEQDVDATEPALQASLTVFTPYTGMESEAMRQSAKALTTLLANTQMLFQKTLSVHWGVAGSAFSGIHELTERQYRELFDAIDEIAERIRALGHAPPPTVRQMMNASELPDDPVNDTVAGMVSMLAGDHEALCRTMREHVEAADERKDHVTADLIVQRLTFHEKAVWMLRATLAS